MKQEVKCANQDPGQMLTTIQPIWKSNKMQGQAQQKEELVFYSVLQPPIKFHESTTNAEPNKANSDPTNSNEKSK